MVRHYKEIAMKEFHSNLRHSGNKHFHISDQMHELCRLSTSNLWENYIMNAQFKRGLVYSVTIEIKKWANLQLQFGVVSNKLFGKCNALDTSECVFCDLKSMRVLKFGEFLPDRPEKAVREGDLVKMRVDRVENVIEWEKKGQDDKFFELMAWTRIPKTLINEFVLFPTISMVSHGDTIRIVK
jgi:hypothetical protein